MPADEPSFFSRDELLGGLPARRASTILFAIEARTAHLVARSKRAMAWYETPRTSSERETVFLEAMAGGRELPLTPRVQDLERFAPTWADLVPDGADLRASLARLIVKVPVTHGSRGCAPPAWDPGRRRLPAARQAAEPIYNPRSRRGAAAAAIQERPRA
jgi:hypothetical protein